MIFLGLVTLREETVFALQDKSLAVVDLHMHLRPICHFHKKQSSRSASREHDLEVFYFQLLDVYIFHKFPNQ